MATIDEKGQLYDAVPATGEMAYDTLVNQLRSTGQGKILRHFHDLRRKGELVARLDTQHGTARLYVSRGALRPDAVG